MPIKVLDNEIRIENVFLSKCLGIKKNRIVSSSVENKLTGETICGAEGTREFAIHLQSLFGGEFIYSDDVKIADVKSEECDGFERLTVIFKEVTVKKGGFNLSLVYELGKLDKHINKYLRFELFSKCDAVLDYIDFEPFAVPDVSKCGYLPKQKGFATSGFALSLGQPVFYDSLAFGCEFPATYNNFENGSLFVRYYSGKPLSQIAKKGVYCSYKSVCVVCEGGDEERRRAGLLSYIQKISKPISLRVQYNSWYDHMLNISDENIGGSFCEIEKNMTAVGSRPLDCYVVDDGWNDYTKGFWGFNSGFPNELYPSSALASSFASTFGLWLGPRGGYTSDTIKFARHIENAGNGFVNKEGGDICVASEKYIDKVEEMMLNYGDRFNLTYWKLDGFALSPCQNKKHDHIVGGKNDMYFYSELWERWISVFEKVCAKAKEKMFLNLTSYAMPSPWFLQWADAVWIQNSLDHGFTDKDERGRRLRYSKKDMALTYRDDRYYEFFRERNFCFPQSNLYNHDPIYGNEAKFTMTDSQFREYLFTMAARGTCFWELYYSYNLMNEAKWRINNSVLLFLNENMHLLKNSVIFGGRPAKHQVYGFGGFGEGEGIVTLRNPSAEVRTYTLSLDHTIGARSSLVNASMVTVLPYNIGKAVGSYSFGDTIEITLSPFETRILHFAKKEKPIEITYCKSRGETMLEVMFNQTVGCESVSCEGNKIKEAKLLDDYRSVLLTFESPFEQENTLKLSGVADIFGNKSEVQLSFRYVQGGRLIGKPIKGNRDFSIQITLDSEQDKVLYEQGSELKISIENGFVYFRIGAETLVAKNSVHDVVQICAVRERNGVLKLYQNKLPDAGKEPHGEPFMLSGEEAKFNNQGKTKVFDYALAYDEV